VADRASPGAFVLLNKFVIGRSAFQRGGETGHDAPFGKDEETECGHHRQRGERESPRRVLRVLGLEGGHAQRQAAIPVTLTGPLQEVGFDRVLQPAVTLLPHD
jgi:hypothetical protein